MREFYMVWVAGRGAPTVVFSDVEDALASAERLRREFTDREVYVLAPVARLDGRPLEMIRDGIAPRRQPVQPAPVVTVRKRRHTVPSSTVCKSSDSAA